MIIGLSFEIENSVTAEGVHIETTYKLNVVDISPETVISGKIPGRIEIVDVL